MQYRIGRLLQIAGLIICPQGIVLELMDKVTVWQSLGIALAGGIVFVVGLSIQRAGGRG